MPENDQTCGTISWLKSNIHITFSSAVYTKKSDFDVSLLKQKNLLILTASLKQTEIGGQGRQGLVPEACANVRRQAHVHYSGLCYKKKSPTSP